MLAASEARERDALLGRQRFAHDCDEQRAPCGPTLAGQDVAEEPGVFKGAAHADDWLHVASAHALRSVSGSAPLKCASLPLRGGAGS